MSDFSRTHARDTDPSTSHDAAESVTNSALAIKLKILQTLSDTMGAPKTAEEIAELCGLTHAQVWRRVSDLKRDSRLVVFDELGVNSSGRRAARYILGPDPSCRCTVQDVTQPDLFKSQVEES